MPLTNALPTAHTRPLSAQELAHLWHQLQQPSAGLELLVLLACLGAAWGLVWLWRGKPAASAAGGAADSTSATGSIWFGRYILDGVLFPALALLLALAARRVLVDQFSPAVFRLAVPVLVSLAAIRLTVKVLKAAFPESRAVVTVERSVSWLAWGATVAWVTGVLPLVLEELDQITWTIGKASLSLRNILEGTLSAILVLILSLSVSSAIEKRLLAGAGENLSYRKILANALRALLLSVGLMVALSAAGVDLTALSVLGGAVGVGLGFGLQKLAANYVSGFVILAERSLRIGDLVKVDDFEGRITDINTRYTVLRSVQGREAIVPNEMLITQRVENASLADNKIMLTTTVQVSYDTDLDKLRPLLRDAVAAVPRVADSPGPGVHLSAFAPDGLELTIAFWLLDPENGQLPPRSEVNLAILACLRQHGVEIPFPQRVVHLPGAGHDVSSAAR